MVTGLSKIGATDTTKRTYNVLNSNTSKTVPGIGKSTYEYDLTADTAGYHSERTTDPKGNVTLNTYDKDDRLVSVKVGDETTAYEYYDNGSRSKVIYPDNTTESYTYDKKNQVISLINKKSDGTVISSYQYTYDGAGNQLTKTEEKGTTTYTYDNVNRLSIVSEPSGKTTSYTYDAAGNRKTEKVQYGLVYGETIYNYNNQNRLISTTSTDGSNIRYTYDYNGNLVSKTAGIIKPISTDNLTAEDLPDFNLIIKHGYDNGTGSGSLTRYTYNQYNRLSSMKSDSTTATYQYNAQGYRVEKSVNGKDTKYLYNADKVVLETDASGSQTAFQAYGSSLLYRTVSADTDHSAQSYYYLYNAHGDVTSLIDTAGNIAATYDYDAFGNLLSKTGSADNYIRFAGYQQDDESGLYYLNARYYDSAIARFITEDDLKYSKSNDPLSLNLYLYCSDNPIRYTDPTGNWAKDVHYDATYKLAYDKFYKYIDKNTDLSKKQVKALAKKYAKALSAGDEYVDQEKNIMHKSHNDKDNTVFHAFSQQDKASDNAFVKKTNKIAGNILSDKSFSKNSIKENIEKYITKPVDKLAKNNTKHTLSTTKAPKDNFKTKQEAAIFVLGMGLHTTQDTEAHAHVTTTGKGQETHIANTDKTNYDYNEKTGKMEIADSNHPDADGERYKATVELTNDYIDDFLNQYGKQLLPPSKKKSNK